MSRILAILCVLLCSASGAEGPTMREMVQFISPPAGASQHEEIDMTKRPEEWDFAQLLKGAGTHGVSLEKQFGASGRPEWAARAVLMLARYQADRVFCGKAERGDAARAVQWLVNCLGEYRFSRVEREDPEECFAYEFVHATDPKRKIWVIWKPSGDPRVARLFHDPWRIERAESMPLGGAGAEATSVRREIEGYFAVEVTERPIFVWLNAPR